MPLSVDGLASIIMGTVRLYRDGVGTSNDCKLVVNHCIRNFGDIAGLPSYRSHYLDAVGGPICREHVVPVNVLMLHIMEEVSGSRLVISTRNVRKMVRHLQTSLVICTVSAFERAILDSFFSRKMPPEWETPGHMLFEDPWARYRILGLYENIYEDC